MKKTCLVVACIALLSSVALPLYGQVDTGGCVNSPENPTAILAVVGSAGAFFVSVRARIKARRSSSK
ncbi:PExPT-CTERM protein [Granulicella sp. S190]|uniref:PExPT-CTERM protein n=1 Tax=Granulicella sp. S190 TaxID=1747226 RepID=UPI00131B1871|nr:PExPT-CTERM protein [Granulicella sp. S190]